MTALHLLRLTTLLLLAANGCGSDDAPGVDADDEPPTFAGATSAIGLEGAIELAWQAGSDDLTPAAELVYDIYEAQSSGAQDLSSPSHTSAPGESSFFVTGLPVSTTRYFVVRARDAAGQHDANAVEVSATTAATTDDAPPSFAGATEASPAGATAITVHWEAGSDDNTPPAGLRYHVYLAQSSGAQDFATPAQVSDAGATSALLSSLESATTYFIVVRAVDLAGNEDSNTEEVSAATASPVSFAADVLPILVAGCTTSACHDAAVPAQDLDLTSDAAYDELVGVAAGQCRERLRVSPGLPDESYLLSKLTGIDMCSGSQMPKGGSLSADQIQTVSDWIAQGAAND